MSLKFFHIAFIFFCAVFALGFGTWCLLFPELPPMFLAMGWISLAGGVALVVYGIRFVRKSRNLIVD